MLSVGLTGSVASGKSETLKAFAAAGARTLSSDAIVKDLMKPASPVVKKIQAHFGPSALRQGGGVCREYLRERVLADPRELDWLERALHPGVRRSIRTFLAKHRRKAAVAVVEVPLLFENGFYKLFDRTAAVRTTAALAELRAAQRGMSPELYRFLSGRQWSAARKAKAADIVITNTGTLRQLHRIVSAAYKKLHADGHRGERDRHASTSFAASAAPARRSVPIAKRRLRPRP